MPKVSLAKSRQLVAAYAEAAVAEATDAGRIGARVSKELVDYQAERALELAGKLSARGAVVLGDPVGTGKTAVALVAATLLMGERKVDRVVIVAPNSGVRSLWKKRAAYLGLDRTKGVEFKTRTLKRARRPLAERKRTLVIVDEAHRGLQNPANAAYERLAVHAADSRVLLVTATPFQVAARGLEHMLCLPEERAQGQLQKRVKVGSIRQYASAVAEFLRAEHDDDPDTTEARAKTKVEAAEPEALRAMEPFFISTFDRSRIGIEDFTRRGIPEAEFVDAGEWAQFYQVLRLIPELPRLHDVITEVRSSDSFQRMLLSSHRAVLEHQAFRDASDWALGSGAKPSVRNLLEVARKRLSAPDPRAHPKVAATSDWVAHHLRSGRHVLVFCVWEKTQPALGEAIRRAAGGFRVETPDRVERARTICDEDGFGRPVGPDNPPIAMVVRDNLSESIDMDGGLPCVVHHDLVWNPVRWDQRMGRVIRASSGFIPLTDGDIFLPVLDVAADRRLYETMRKRRDLSGHVLRMASLVGDEEVE